jgi:hypothetical protein
LDCLQHCRLVCVASHPALALLAIVNSEPVTQWIPTRYVSRGGRGCEIKDICLMGKEI